MTGVILILYGLIAVFLCTKLQLSQKSIRFYDFCILPLWSIM